jgi:Zn-finger nucleic acid-binding protein
MNCPACKKELATQNISGVLLNVCAEGCGGIWFDWPELSKFDEPQDAGQELLTIEKNESQIVNQSRRYSCPHCSDIVMARHFIKVQEDVLVDECPSCGGLWLNGDELDEIRAQFKNEACTLESADLSGDKAASTDRQDLRIKRFINVIRFLCPSQFVG